MSIKTRPITYLLPLDGARLVMGAALALVLAGGCGGNGDGGGAGGAPGGTGGARTGGTSGGGGGTPGGTGGTPTASGGVSGGAGGSATGGTGAGGSGSGTGGTSGTDTGPGPDGSGSDLPASDTPPASDAFLDECFVGLRAFVENYQIANKRAANGQTRVRLALERVPGSVGTSGSVIWKAVRVGIVAPQGNLCIKDEAALAGKYVNSVHNCMDTLTVVADGRTYKLDNPDTDVRAFNTRTTTKLTINPGATVTSLSTENCTARNDAACSSGGTCN